MWFEKLTGFKEINSQQVRQNIEISENKLISKVNRAEYIFGKLELLSVSELQNIVKPEEYSSKISVSQIVANVSDLHADKLNSGALFQVASQFNLLEMTSPQVTP